MRITNATRDTLLAERATEARSFPARFLGWMGKREILPGEALHIVPCNGIHTLFMRTPIDALFLDQDLKVVRTYSRIQPWRVTPVILKVTSVLELAPGTVEATYTTRGDQLVLTPST
jgi:uncharacterized membrane protein (UPF0127 family)